MIKRLGIFSAGLFSALLVLSATLYAAGVTNISSGSSLPTNCNAGNIFVKTSATAGLYWCSTPGSPGTWSAVGGGSAITSLTGDVTASGPGAAAATIASNAVTTSKINNGAVTLAKIANASANSKLLGSGASGSGSPYGELTLGSGFSVSGTTIIASGGSGGGGSLILLEPHTASSSATLDFTSWYSSSYDDYVIELIDILPATTSNLMMQVSTNGGTSYDTNPNYATSCFRWSKSGSSTAGSASAVNVDLGGELTVSNDATEQALSGAGYFYNPGGTSGWKKLRMETAFWYNGTPELIGAKVVAAYKSASAVNAVRFKMSSGNIASGTIRIYGVAH